MVSPQGVTLATVRGTCWAAGQFWHLSAELTLEARGQAVTCARGIFGIRYTTGNPCHSFSLTLSGVNPHFWLRPSSVIFILTLKFFPQTCVDTDFFFRFHYVFVNCLSVFRVHSKGKAGRAELDHC